MADTKKSKVVSNIWNNWCKLEANQRSAVADRLGPLGHMLSIAANVHQLATNPNATNPQSKNKPTENVDDYTKSADNTSADDNEGDDVIDVEFEEI
jgi:hypothetical protein